MLELLNNPFITSYAQTSINSYTYCGQVKLIICMVIKMDSDVHSAQCKHNCPLHSIEFSAFEVPLGGF